MIARGVEVEAQLGGAGADGRLVAEDRELRRRRAAAGCDAARRIRSSLALGQHHVLAVRPGAVQQGELEHQRRDHLGPLARRARPAGRRRRRAARTGTARCRPCAASRAVRRPCVSRDGARGPERAQLGADDRQPAARGPSTSRAISGAGRKPPLRMMPGQRREPLGLVRHEQAEQHVRPVAGRDDDGAVGQPVQQVLDRHRADDDVEHLARQQRLVARDERAAHRLRQLPDRRRGEQRVLRAPPTTAARCRRAGRRGRRSTEPGAHRLATTATTWAWLACISVTTTSATWAITAGLRCPPLTTSTTGAPRFAAMRALYASSVGPATSV